MDVSAQEIVLDFILRVTSSDQHLIQINFTFSHKAILLELSIDSSSH